jgi:hypothetical protein
LKKFYIYKANLIKDFAYSASKVPNIINVKKFWHLINSKNKSFENNNKNNINNKTNKNTNKLFKNKININKL